MNTPTTYRALIFGCLLTAYSFPVMAQKNLILPSDTFNPAQIHDARTELANQIPSSPRLLNTAWVTTRINGDPVHDDAPTLTMEQNRAYGSSGCNRYTGKVTLSDNNRLEFGPSASTRMACPSKADQQEAAYFRALASVSAYHLNHGSLILLDAQYNKILEFTNKKMAPEGAK